MQESRRGRAGAAWLLLLVAPLPGHAQQPGGVEGCEEAIAAAEAGSGLPAGLLSAIARTESGRPDPLTRRVAAWPWTINAAGVGAHFTSREEAVARVRELLARGILSVDVGCMQINLRHHPAAFATLEEAFEPRANVAYAIRFLTELRLRHGEWPAAIAGYHSADPVRGSGYLRRVNLAWTGAPSAASAPPSPGSADGGGRESSVMRFLPASARVQVFTPAALTPSRHVPGIVTIMPGRR
ncbi:transglycosylase SLT domain-containing protein [Roseomonas populi]|uniref:Transglycosylase SLT domain-containing protein n=1 Tax=Roseomonas populi TaxID=3121582 RepID=A0ABT1X180_9PROT|nr:transglycosylase SLT domain-containing protein [Roseomonas pecuniae]MCR0981861.1 transglycosylase SLT domain-containing protein [Roseomonas pecuniae]